MTRAIPGSLLLVLLWGCSSLVQTVKNQDCALDAQNPFDVVEVDLNRHELRLFWKRPDGTLIQTIDALREWVGEQGDSLIAAANAGIYEPGYVPSGLFIEEGVVRQPLNLADGLGNFYLKPNGVFLLSDEGAAIVEASEFDSLNPAVRYAIQSGPLLLSGGELHPEFRPGSENCRLRSGIGVGDGRSAYVVISNGAVNFDEFARYFRDTLGVSDALYLDGGISELYAPGIGRSETGRQRFAVILAVINRNWPDSGSGAR